MFKQSLARGLTRVACLSFITSSTISLSSVAFAQVEQAMSTQNNINRDAAASQQRINKLSDETATSLQTYRSALQRSESLEIYNAQLKRLIDSQQTEMVSVQEQTEQIETIELGVLPLMVRMVDTLDKLVKADAPFLVAERTERVNNLKSLINRADVTVGEKYRRIMEAYMVEADYGRTIEAYSGELDNNGEPRSVDFLRIGRTGLYYQTLDGQSSGRWNKDDNAWVTLDNRFRRDIRDGIRIARKQAPPELLTLPVSAPQATTNVAGNTGLLDVADTPVTIRGEQDS